MKMNNKTYDTLKIVALVVIPFLATLMSGLTEIFGIQIGSSIAAYLTLVGTALGTALVTSSRIYNKEENEE